MDRVAKVAVFLLLSLAKYRVVQGGRKSGSRAAALQMTSSQYYAQLSKYLALFVAGWLADAVP
jgi:hypothetical protein